MNSTLAERSEASKVPKPASGSKPASSAKRIEPKARSPLLLKKVDQKSRRVRLLPWSASVSGAGAQPRMNSVILLKGTEYGSTRIIKVLPERAFEMWCSHYDIYLKRLYGVFQNACIENSVDWYNHISFPTFCHYIYNNSSRYLSFWI